MKFPFGDVVVLLLYLLPGFLAMQLYRARYPSKRLSQFEAIVWSILHSLFIHFGLRGVTYFLGCEDLVSLDPKAHSEIPTMTIGVLILGGVVWGGVLIVQYQFRVLVPFLQSPDPQAIWPVVAAAPKEELWTVARTKQGTLYLGWVKKYSFDPAVEDHDFLLCPAYLVDDDLNVKRDLSVGGVYLNTRDIESLEMVPGNPR